MNFFFLKKYCKEFFSFFQNLVFNYILLSTQLDIGTLKLSDKIILQQFIEDGAAQIECF